MRSDDVLTFAVESKHFGRQPPGARHVRAEGRSTLFRTTDSRRRRRRLWDVNEYCKSHCYWHVMRRSRQPGTYSEYVYIFTPPPGKPRSTTLTLAFSLSLLVLCRPPPLSLAGQKPNFHANRTPGFIAECPPRRASRSSLVFVESTKNVVARLCLTFDDYATEARLSERISPGLEAPFKLNIRHAITMLSGIEERKREEMSPTHVPFLRHVKI